jgi:hypothetical protein
MFIIYKLKNPSDRLLFMDGHNLRVSDVSSVAFNESIQAPSRCGDSQAERKAVSGLKAWSGSLQLRHPMVVRIGSPASAWSHPKELKCYKCAGQALRDMKTCRVCGGKGRLAETHPIVTAIDSIFRSRTINTAQLLPSASEAAFLDPSLRPQSGTEALPCHENYRPSCTHG